MDFQDLKCMVLDARARTEEWRCRAHDWYAIYEGNQWTEEQLCEADRLCIELLTFNHSAIVIDSITGLEVNNRQGIEYEARQANMQQKGLNEVLNAASDHFRDEADSEDVESSAFRQMAICGLGATETHVDYDNDPEGKMGDGEIDFREIIFDPDAKKRNLSDAGFVGRVREMLASKAKDLFPGHTANELNACWIDGVDPDEDGEGKTPQRVQIVHIQWCEYEDRYVSVRTGQPLTDDEVKEVRDAGFEMLIRKNGKRRVWKQAFLGANELLEPVDYCPSKDRPSIALMGYEREKSTDECMWYGMLKRVEGPQKLLNQLLTKILENVSYSGSGYDIERSAVKDIDKFLEGVTNPRVPNIFEDGALSRGQVKPTTPSQLPNGMNDLIAMAMSAFQNLTGITLEMLGMADREQSGVVENARKQSAYTTLAPLFDRLKSYRIDKGRLQLDYIREYLSDGRLIRVAGEGAAQYVPLVRLPDEIRFSVRVDEQATSPNNKDKVMASLPMMASLTGGPLPPAVISAALPYTDLPSSLIQAWQEIGQQPDPNAQMQQQAMQLEVQKTQSEIAENTAQARHNEAQALSELAQAAKWQAEAGLNQQRSVTEVIRPQIEALSQIRGLMQ